MSRGEADRILDEWFAVTDASQDPELQSLSNALFLEETFGVTLSDADIDPAAIGSVEGMRRVLTRLTGWP